MDAFRFQGESGKDVSVSKCPKCCLAFFSPLQIFFKKAKHNLLRAATHDVVLPEDMRTATTTTVEQNLQSSVRPLSPCFSLGARHNDAQVPSPFAIYYGAA
jgi:hypothetical protein